MASCTEGSTASTVFFFWRNNTRKPTKILNGTHRHTSREASQAPTVSLGARATASDTSPFLSEVYYKVSGKCFFALGFQNDAGGWELRNPYFNGCFAPKAITTIKGTDSHKLQFFEGFIDFLSWRKLHPEVQDDSIILNSLTLLPKLIPTLHPYPIIESRLANDEAGDRATKQLFDAGLPVKDMRACYAPYKDINEYLILAEQKKQILTSRKRGLHR